MPRPTPFAGPVITATLPLNSSVVSSLEYCNLRRYSARRAGYPPGR